MAERSHGKSRRLRLVQAPNQDEVVGTRLRLPRRSAFSAKRSRVAPAGGRGGSGKSSGLDEVRVGQEEKS